MGWGRDGMGTGTERTRGGDTEGTWGWGSGWEGRGHRSGDGEEWVDTVGHGDRDGDTSWGHSKDRVGDPRDGDGTRTLGNRVGDTAEGGTGTGGCWEQIWDIFRWFRTF